MGAGAKDKKTNEKKSPREVIGRLFELPSEAVMGMPRLELGGNRELFIESCRGILEYSDECIRVNAGRFIIKITGRGLELKSMTSSELVIQGVIFAVEFVV